MDYLDHLLEQQAEFEQSRQRIAIAFHGCSGPCDQGRITCPTRELCFGQAPAAVDPVPAPSSFWRRVGQRVIGFWRRHVIDHDVWE